MSTPQTPQSDAPAPPKQPPTTLVKPPPGLDPDSLETVDNSRRIVEVNLTKDPLLGCGFNIVGGTDSPHIPGHSGIFISRLNSEGPAAKDGRLRCGDRILCVNDNVLTKKTHDEAVDIFKQVSGKVRLLIEQDAEAVLLSQPSRIIPSAAGSPAASKALGSKTSTTVIVKVPSVAPSGGLVKVTTPTGSPTVSPNSSMIAAATKPGVDAPTPIRPDVPTEPDATTQNGTKRGERHQSFREPPTSATYTVPEPATPAPNPDSRRSSFSNSGGGSTVTNGAVLPGPHFELEDDRASTISVAPSTHSIIDDVPRTPKRPISILDPASPSILTEALYVTVGVAALGVGIVAGYYFFKRRWG
uniref:PDZ domain-containing protein n=1 Tax=Panagrellus redivivus TaxID=6233 RepID=A0A7E4VVL4_PANRE